MCHNYDVRERMESGARTPADVEEEEADDDPEGDEPELEEPRVADD